MQILKSQFRCFALLLGIFLFIFGNRSLISQDKQLREMQALGDTLFQNVSIEEMKKIQEEYQKRVDKIVSEEEKMRDMGLEVTETLLEREGENIKDRDKILIRMAEYYIEEADEEFMSRNEEFDRAYQEYLSKLDQYYAGQIEQEPVPPENIKYDYSKAIGIYDKILAEFRNSEYADDALYSKAYLIQQMGQDAQSRQIYQEVIDRYPDSDFAAESYMRLAEYYFDPREDKDTEQTVVELQKAIKLYKKVLQYQDSKRYDEALYKLGWSYYRLTATDANYYSDAIVHFLAVVDDITKAENLDPKDEITSPNVKQEAIQYIGISFSDDENYSHAGVQNARDFIENIGGREYGVDIMRALGETYQNIEKNDQAISAYAALLEMYPFYEEAPLIKQNIAQTYYNLGRDDDEYRTRYELFRDYNPNSDWYNYIVNSEIPDRLKYEQEAYKLSERALYTNIALDLEKAQELDEQNQTSDAMYEIVAQGCQEYLQVFATDSNAYNINWYYALILDEHLQRFDEAYEQYILVSNDYLEIEHQEESANNAIFVADTLVKIALGTSRDTTGLIDLSDRENIRPEVLTSEEKRLIEAYDNYIRLFPDGENTPVYLAAAGGIYFNHKQFAEARTYFKTLVSRFPGAKEKNIAMRSIMESYFALGQFRDSEFIAKRILQAADLPEEQKVFAAKRLASSIFNNAKLYEDQGQFLEAATEYKRVYEETPDDTTYTEAALFNSGQNYDKVKEWQSALETYVMLAEKYPESKYALPALGNAAEDYKELKQYDDAGAMYERIYALNVDNPEQAEVALYNASYYYKLGEDWTNTIRINNQYIATYPDNDIAIDLYFANAGHYLKLDNLTEANQIYEQFALKYPDDPRSVEAFYQRGTYFAEHQQPDAAKAEFNKAIRKSEQLSSQGLDPNRYYVGEALNSLSGMLYDEYDSIELRQPQSNISAQQNRMRELITEIINTNQKVVANGSIRSFEAVYKNAEIYEKFANKYVDQERNQGLDKNAKFAEDKRINEESAALYDKAVSEYKNAMENIPQIADKFGVDIFSEDTVSIADAGVDTLFADTSFAVARAEQVDSTKEVAKKWYDKATSKISFLYYKEADITKANIDEALNTENPYSNDPLRGLIYSVQLISTVINPAVQQTIQAHERNIQEGDQLGLSNKYTEESKRQILMTSNIPPQELEKLVFSALASYSKNIKEYKKLVELEYGTTNEKGEDYVLIADNVKQMVDYSKALAISTMDNYTNTIKLAQKQNIYNDLVRTTENRMLRLAIELTDLYTVYHDSAVVNDSLYTGKFAETENYNFDDASLFFQDLAFNFNDYEREILDYAFQLKEEYDMKNLWANLLLAKLIKIDPATYAGSIEREKIFITSDDTWLYSTQYFQGYNKFNFDDSSWKRTGIVASAYNQFAGLGVDPSSMWVSQGSVLPDTSLVDSLGISIPDSTVELDTLVSQDTTNQIFETPDIMAERNTATVDTIYFRKKINLQGTPVDGNIYLTADDDYIFFLNEEYIVDDEANNFAILDTLDFSYISYFIKQGENILAFRAVDLDHTAGGVKIYGYIELLPLDITAAVREKSEIKKLDVDPVILKKINTLNKNRISLKQ